MVADLVSRNKVKTLNESPSEKEGKYLIQVIAQVRLMALNESPSEKEGKLG